MSRRPFLALLLVLAGFVGGAAPAVARPLPDVIPLPNGFQPEGISAGPGKWFYVGSLVDGSIYRGDVRTGEGQVVIDGPGSPAIGTEVDHGILWVAGGPAGTGRAYDLRTGDLVAEWTFTTDPSFINDVVVTGKAAYFTDSTNPVLYKVPLTGGHRPGDAFETLPYSGDIAYQDGFNANGIEASSNGRTLYVVQSNTGLLFAVDPSTGETTQVDVGGASLSFGDGLLQQGNRLYVVRNQLNQIDVVKLHGTAGRVTGTITDDDFMVPTTVAKIGSSLYAVNARFDVAPTPDTEYSVVRVDRN